MPPVPGCTGLGRHCRELPVTLRIADLDEDSPAERDDLATWLLGHSGRIGFGAPYRRGSEVLVDAVVRVPCRYLEDGDPAPRRNGGPSDAAARCAAHGFREAPPPLGTAEPRRYRHADDRFTIVQDGRVRWLDLPLRTAPRRALTVLDGPNPCATAACRTSDNVRGAACCRDLTLDVVAPEGQSDHLEDLLRARRVPYLCKVSRTNSTTIECEAISACGYLDADGVTCTLHDRIRPNGEPAKPAVCCEWPDPEEDDEFTGHAGCVFLDRTTLKTS